jgi:protein involved in polysaccharide export with SLBB domain
LVSTAGGPTASADLGRVVLIRERDGTRQRINLVRLASSGRPLFLVPGDVVIVPQSFWSRFRSELPVVTTVVAIANVALTLVLMTQR